MQLPRPGWPCGLDAKIYARSDAEALALVRHQCARGKEGRYGYELWTATYLVTLELPPKATTEQRRLRRSQVGDGSPRRLGLSSRDPAGPFFQGFSTSKKLPRQTRRSRSASVFAITRYYPTMRRYTASFLWLNILVMGIAVAVAGCVSPYDAAPRQEQLPKQIPNVSIPGAPTREVEVGLASWYRSSPRKRHAADGKRYDEDALIAAHRTLPFNTMVRVTNIENGRSVELRVADRGPHVVERIIDVSSRAASELDMKREGIVPVQVEVIAIKEIEPGDSQ